MASNLDPPYLQDYRHELWCPAAEMFLKVLFIKVKNFQAQWLTPVNSSYSGGRDQEDCGSKPVQAKSLRDPISKKPNTRVWLRLQIWSFVF
jgi:hypothetical protein